jgi:hypothetical protein
MTKSWTRSRLICGFFHDGLKSGADNWENRRHFFAAVAEAMRRILIDQARRKLRAKRGGERKRMPLDDLAPLAGPQGEPVEDLLALDAGQSESLAVRRKDRRRALGYHSKKDQRRKYRP